MEGLTKLQQKRFILIGLGGLLAIFIAFFAQNINQIIWTGLSEGCLLYTSPSPRD